VGFLQLEWRAPGEERTRASHAEVSGIPDREPHLAGPALAADIAVPPDVAAFAKRGLPCRDWSAAEITDAMTRALSAPEERPVTRHQFAETLRVWSTVTATSVVPRKARACHRPFAPRLSACTPL